MRRDMDVVRELLLRLEAVPMRAGSAAMLPLNRPPLVLDGDEVDEIAYNLRLLTDAGFLNLTKNQGADTIGILGLTWQGHEFLDTVRDPEIWHKTKEGAKKAGGFTVGLLSDLAKGLIKTQIEKHTGVKL